jgi:hypothetical protein
MQYTDAIKREVESIGQWCRRYFGISGCDEQRSHFRFHQRRDSVRIPVQRIAVLLFEKHDNKRV